MLFEDSTLARPSCLELYRYQGIHAHVHKAVQRKIDGMHVLYGNTNNGEKGYDIMILSFPYLSALQIGPDHAAATVFSQWGRAIWAARLWKVQR